MRAFRFELLTLPPEAEAMRRKVRAFLDDERANKRYAAHRTSWSTFDPEFSRRTAAAGFIGMTWPKQYGGGEHSNLERFVVTEEMLAAGAPVRRPLDRRPAVRSADPQARQRARAPVDPAEDRGRRMLFRHRHERAGFRLRPRRGAHATPTRSTAAGASTAQDLDLQRASRALSDRAGADRAAQRGPPCRPVAVHRRYQDGRRHRSGRSSISPAATSSTRSSSATASCRMT